ncbi:MAG: hypothetical protein ACK5B9_04540 [Flavobacteriia bacterium]|jgi:hypothetical protein
MFIIHKKTISLHDKLHDEDLNFEIVFVSEENLILSGEEIENCPFRKDILERDGFIKLGKEIYIDYSQINHGRIAKVASLISVFNIEELVNKISNAYYYIIDQEICTQIGEIQEEDLLP